MTTSVNSGSDCACGTGQVDSQIACPVCSMRGRTVDQVTPQKTVRKTALDQFDAERNYHFCTNPDCDVVYYSDKDVPVIKTDALKNRVTIKDDSPETPLCYCFKVLKKHAIEEIARTGTTNVFKQIQEKMKPGQSCFCEKANPRGDTCSQDIKEWVEAQGIKVEEPVGRESQSDCGCGPSDPASTSGSGCCG